VCCCQDDADDYEAPDLLLAEELLSGDGRLDAMRRLVNLKELEEIWGNPKAAHRLLQGEKLSHANRSGLLRTGVAD
jgi:hypothetical protein